MKITSNYDSVPLILKAIISSSFSYWYVSVRNKIIHQVEMFYKLYKEIVSWRFYNYIYIRCLSVCLYPINVKIISIESKFFFENSHDPREGFRLLRFSKNCLQKNQFPKIWKNMMKSYFILYEEEMLIYR